MLGKRLNAVTDTDCVRGAVDCGVADIFFSVQWRVIDVRMVISLLASNTPNLHGVCLGVTAETERLSSSNHVEKWKQPSASLHKFGLPIIEPAGSRELHFHESIAAPATRRR